MENYVRVKPERQQGKTEENEIRINAQGKPRAYITYATTLLTEKEFKSVVIKATGQAINKAVGIGKPVSLIICFHRYCCFSVSLTWALLIIRSRNRQTPNPWPSPKHRTRIH